MRIYAKRGDGKKMKKKKDSGWVTSRQGLWDAREEGVHEVSGDGMGGSRSGDWGGGGGCE